MSAATRVVPLSQPWLDEREEDLVLDVLRSGRLSLGPSIDAFEEQFAQVVGAPYAAAVSSGTAGLHLLCVAAGIGPGDEVITSPYSFVASANCAVYEGAIPVFADIDARTLNLDPAAVEAAVTERTKAVVAVDIFGYPSELDDLQEICERRGLTLVDDACEALGARYRGRRVGSQGQDAVFAFYPNKQITTGEGGMVTTWSEETWRLLKSLRNQGRADGGGWLDHARLGFNYRLDDVRAAIGIGQLERLDAILAARTTVAERYRRLLDGLEGLELPCPDDDDHVRSWFVFVVALPGGADREMVIESLAGRGIQTARYLPCIHLQTYMRERYGFREGLCPVAEATSRRTLALPFHARLTEDDQVYVADALRAALAL
ncbi:MAG TPA: DegT/DnrJ/EryC1/StrS family aminotransferase [Gaiellaceae bacterium]|nr:DegT/DnrJ/EryC1/StrS family aminotransferase [Gaiellaceae bacterium]